IIAESKEEGFNVCLMKDGLCSRPDCNHYSGVHVQLPYFLNQPPKGSFNRWTQQRPEAPAGVPRPTAAPAPYSKAPSAAFQQAPGPNMQAQYFAGTGSACGSSMPPSGLFGKAAGAPPPISQPNWGGVWPNDGSGGQSQGGWQDNAGWGGKGGWGQQGGGGWKGGNGGWNGGGAGWNGGGGGWNGGGDGGGKGGGGKKGGGKGGHQMWQGTALVHKARKDVKVSEGSSDLGFQWRYLGEGQPPQVILVNPITSVGQIAQETLRTVLLRLLGALAEVQDMQLRCTSEAPTSSFLNYMLSSTEGVEDEGIVFAFKVIASDPNDVEPLRETLLLEGESGGARRLLPLLAEQLCDDGLPTPRRLKVRIEVRGAR
ncbi:unnamed protein product, partial [Polarella glacialis]